MKYKKINNKSNLGVEIHDFKIENHCSSIYINEIRNLWLENSILIFKNLKLDHHQFESFSLLFGEFVRKKPKIGYGALSKVLRSIS